MKFSYSLIKKMVPGLPAKKRLVEELNLKSFEAEDGGGDLINIEIPHNRYSDAASHWGVAKEAAAIFNLKPKEPKGIAKILKFSGRKGSLSVKISRPDLCPRYTALLVEIGNLGQSPSWLNRALITCGLKPINLAVDVMNYVMLETGQPLHAFDADKVDKGLVIRAARQGEVITTLDNQKFKLDGEMLVIADAVKPVAIAGIKGGKDAEVSAKTKRIIIEAANFDPVNIYKTSRRLNLVTDASSRFAHGVSPALTEMGVSRAFVLLEELARARFKDFVDINKAPVGRKIIGFSMSKFSSLIGLNLDKKEAASYLVRLGFKILLPKTSKGEKFDFLVEVPTVRTDVNIFEDLVEEVTRLYDYNKIPSKTPFIGMEPAREDATLKVKDRIRLSLVGTGFSEVYNYSFSSEGKESSYELENPAAPDKRFLRDQLKGGLQDNLKDNSRFFQGIRIFEIGKVFNKKTQEELHLGIALDSKDDPFFELKGVVGHLLQRLGVVDLFFRPKDRGLVIESDNEVLGEIVFLHKDSAAAEINLDKLTRLLEEEYEFLPLPKYPAVMRDLSLEMREAVQVGDILNAIETAPAKDVRDVDLIDYYDSKRFTFRLVFQSDKRTLTDVEVNKELDSIIKVLKRKFRLQVR